jgi:hypothetical protein
MNMKTIQVAALLSLSVSSMAFGQQAVQWKASDGGNGHWYRAVPSSGVRWQDSREFAVSLGGHLVTLSSQQEEAFARALAPDSVFWIGASRVAGAACSGQSGWAWVSGESFDYAGWAATQPDCWASGQLYLAVNNISYLPGWHDYDDAPMFMQVIEWSVDCNSDGVVDYGQCRSGALPDYDGNFVPDCCESGSSCILGSYPVQWHARDGGNGHWYQLVVLPSVSWQQANSAAAVAGAHLCSIGSNAESEWVWQRLASNPGAWRTANNAAGPHLGGQCDAQGNWSWVTGEPWEFENIGPCFNGGSTGETKLHFGCQTIENRWNDIAADDSNAGGYILEWSTDCNSDGIVDFGQILRGQLPDMNGNGIADGCECATNPGLPACCEGNLNGDPAVDGADLGILLNAWGTCAAPCAADLNRDGFVDGADLGILLGRWGTCPA